MRRSGAEIAWKRNSGALSRDIARLFTINMLFRAAARAAFRLPETFKTLQIGYVSLAEQADTSTPSDKMVFMAFGGVVELERGLIASGSAPVL
jgi:DNA invertase Pin-like site-specific DNA recombinase